MPKSDDLKEAQLIFTDFERKIAQKMALDIRYFCDESYTEDLNQDLHKNVPQSSYKSLFKDRSNQKSVTKLPLILAKLIQDTDIGGIVLFAENLVSTDQIIRLTTDLQNAALASKSAKPLIISIDQEGGRVVRLPHATSFAGNMAIGATYANNKTNFAIRSGEIIGKELNALGINNNYAPVVDVNINAENPVINTRSFGESPQQVSKLGVAVVNGLQKFNVMATLKHFPGHGDTHIDSHLGLPRVDHDLATIEKIDLAPFKWAINNSEPAMIMTAHIQYPALDNTTFISKEGVKTMRPATMSRKILTDLLRDKMKFKGIIATDALDMAGVAHYFDEVTATVETFAAGADLAVMPFKIRVPDDIDKFKRYVKAVSKQLNQKITQGQLSYNEIDQSLARLNYYKNKYIRLSKLPVQEQIKQADQIIACDEHIAQQQLLVNEATVLLKNKNNSLPLSPDKIKHIHLLVASEQDRQALQYAITKQWKKTKQWHQAGKNSLKITSVIGSQKNTLANIKNISQLSQADLVIATVDMKITSAVDLGGVDDLLKQTGNSKVITEQSLNKSQLPQAVSAEPVPAEPEYDQLVQWQIALAKKYAVKSLLIARGSPYLISPYLKSVDSALLIFDDKVIKNSKGDYISAGINASLAIAVGASQAKGVLPVS